MEWLLLYQESLTVHRVNNNFWEKVYIDNLDQIFRLEQMCWCGIKTGYQDYNVLFY